MPPKLNLHKSKGKCKSISTVGPSTSNAAQSSANTGTPALDEETIEAELAWCIHQLQDTLKIDNLDPKRAKDATLAMKVLTSNNAPLVKKRQVMRNSFGDYRAKMRQEQKKMDKKCQNITLAPGIPNKKSQFIKKAKTQTEENDFSAQGTSENEIDLEKENKENTTKTQFHFQKSDNTFRFNFSIDNDDTS